MTEDRHILYEALLHRDERYDGKLFFAVTTTGIYCRPICPAPKPKPQNVLYFASAEDAQEAGFRACKRCRPETRPGSPAWEGSKTTVVRALRLMATGDAPETLAELADKLGVTDRHLRRLFATHGEESPVKKAQENRLSLARVLLATSDAPIADVAFSAGYKSLRRFNEAFKASEGISPTAWRSKQTNQKKDPGS